MKLDAAAASGDLVKTVRIIRKLLGKMEGKPLGSARAARGAQELSDAAFDASPPPQSGLGADAQPTAPTAPPEPPTVAPPQQRETPPPPSPPPLAGLRRHRQTLRLRRDSNAAVASQQTSSSSAP